MGVSILNNKQIIDLISLGEKGYVTLKDLQKKFGEEFDLEEIKEILAKENIDFFIDEYNDDEEFDIENVSDTELLSTTKTNPGIAGYIKEICSYKILSFEEEQTLRVQIRQGRLADSELLNQNGLTNDEIEKLTFLSEKGKIARDKIILTHLRLVLHFARKFQGKGVSLEDLIQEGTQGMLYAIEKFDMKRNIKFSTYATFWIRQACQKAISELGNSKKIPASAQYQLNRFLKTKARMAQELGHEPTDDEVCKVLNISIKKFKTIQDSYNSQAISLEKPINQKKQDSDDICLEDIIASNEKTPIEKLIEKEKNNVLYKTISTVLNDREIYIIYHRYGLKGCQKRTLEELGNVLGITRERVRQIEEKILEKLRSVPELCSVLIS